MRIDMIRTVGIIWDCMEQDYKMISTKWKPVHVEGDLTVVESWAVRNYDEDMAVCEGWAGW